MADSATSRDVVTAINLFRPTVRAYVEQAQAEGGTNESKHEAVFEASRLEYQALQGAIREFRLVPWEMVAPVLVPFNEGVISACVRFFKMIGHGLFPSAQAKP